MLFLFSTEQEVRYALAAASPSEQDKKEYHNDYKYVYAWYSIDALLLSDAMSNIQQKTTD